MTASKDLAERIERLERGIVRRDELLKIVAHDLRNLLNTLSVGADLLSQAGAVQTENARRVLPRFRSAVDRMSRMLADMLDAAAIERGDLSIQPESVSLDALLDGIETELRPEAENRSIVFEVEAAFGAPLTVDRARIRQALLILVHQALKFTPAGGRIALRVDLEHGRIRFLVSDTGPALPAEEIEKLFEHLGAGLAQPRRAGIGLQIAIARGIAEAHGGRIWAERDLDHGAVFGFEVPITRLSAE